MIVCIACKIHYNNYYGIFIHLLIISLILKITGDINAIRITRWEFRRKDCSNKRRQNTSKIVVGSETRKIESNINAKRNLRNKTATATTAERIPMLETRTENWTTNKVYFIRSFQPLWLKFRILIFKTPFDSLVLYHFLNFDVQSILRPLNFRVSVTST